MDSRPFQRAVLAGSPGASDGTCSVLSACSGHSLPHAGVAGHSLTRVGAPYQRAVGPASALSVEQGLAKGSQSE